MKRLKTLRSRLILGVLGAVALAWLILTGASYFQTQHELGEVLDAHLAQSATLLLAQTAGETEEDGQAEVSPLHHYQQQVAFQIWDVQGQLRHRSRSAPSERLSPTEEGFSTHTVEFMRWRVFSLRNYHEGGLIQVGERLDARQHISAEVAESVLAPLFVALPLLGLLLVVTVGQSLKPLTLISHEISRRDANSLDPIETERVPREILPVIDQLNGLFERIRGSLETEKRFTADAAHELRTPIAGIRLQAQVARNAMKTEDRNRALDNVLTGCDRSSRIMEQLLTLAHLDEGREIVQFEAVDLALLARDILKDMGPEACQRGIALEFEAAEITTLKSNEALLRILLRNLVDNAIRYSPTHSKVTVRLSHEDAQHVCLEVCDQGPGIPPEERLRVMERFYRGKDQGASGSGLGLSIVKRIVDLLGAKMLLLDGDNPPGLKVRVELPMWG